MGQDIKKSDKRAFKREIKYFIDKGKYDIALSKINDFLKAYPKDIFALTYKSIVYRKKKDYDKAIQILEPIINSQINDKLMRIFSMREYARSLLESRRNDEALYYYMQVINESDNYEVESRAMIAQIYKYDNNLEDAIDILTIDDDNEFLAIKRALTYYDFRKWNMIPTELNKFRRKDITHDNLRQEYDFLYGEYFFNIGEFDEARKYFYNACNVKNTYYFFEANIKLAIIDSVYDDIASSIIRLKNSINDKSINFSSRNSAIIALSNVYLKIGDYDSANKTLEMLDERFSRKNLEIGKLYLFSNDYERAEQILTECSRKYEFDHYDTLFYLALTKFRLKKYDEAYSIADNVLKAANNIDNELHKIRIELKKLKLYIDLIHYTPIRKNKEEFNYMEGQIFSYSKNRAIKHIIKHHKGINKMGRFEDDFRVEKMINLVSNSLDEERKISCEVLDKYVISSNSIGFDSDNNFSIMVLTIPNTKQIVNMFVLNIDLNDEKKQEMQPKKVKRMSQIEKFNKRYNKTQE